MERGQEHELIILPLAKESPYLGEPSLRLLLLPYLSFLFSLSKKSCLSSFLSFNLHSSLYPWMMLSAFSPFCPKKTDLQGNLTVTDYFKNPDTCLPLPWVYPIPSAATFPTISPASSRPVVPHPLQILCQLRVSDLLLPIGLLIPLTLLPFLWYRCCVNYLPAGFTPNLKCCLSHQHTLPGRRKLGPVYLSWHDREQGKQNKLHYRSPL